MNKKRVVVTFAFVCTAILLVPQASAIFEFPSDPIPPTITNVHYVSNSATQVTIYCTVTWHYSYGIRLTKVYVQGSWKSMTYIGGGVYSRTITDLDISQSYNYRIKAVEAVNDYIDVSTTTGWYVIAKYIPTISVEFSSSSSETAICSWTVTSWGRLGSDNSHSALLKFRHPGSNNVWDVSLSYSFYGSSGSYTIDGLVFNTDYEYSVQMECRDWNTGEVVAYSNLISGTFNTQEWNPSHKYALIICMNYDDDEGLTYAAHQAEFSRMQSAVAGSFDQIRYVQMQQGDDASDFLYELAWPARAGSDSNSFVFIYIVGHGDRGWNNGVFMHKLMLGGQNTGFVYVWEDVISNTLDGIPYGQMVITLEACYSGGLIEPLALSTSAGNDPVIITSSASDWVSGNQLYNGQAACTFSRTFINSLSNGGNLYESFQAASDYCALEENWTPDPVNYIEQNQDPWLDDSYPYDVPEFVGNSWAYPTIGSSCQVAWALWLGI